MSDHTSAGPGGTGDHMDANETLVKERFDAAVAGISPDVVSLTGGGIAAGRGIRRRRRMQGAVGVLAVTAIAVGALTATGAIGNLLNSQGADSTSRPGKLVELQPATPRGLAAAVMAHTAGLGTLIAIGGQSPGRHNSDAQLRDGVTVDMGYRTDDGIKVELQVVASPHTASWKSAANCASQARGTCTQARLPDGTTRVVLRADADGTAPSAAGTFSGPHVIAVGVLRRDQFVIAVETVVNSTQSPLGVAALEAIATDPAVGVTTTQALNTQGLGFRHFKANLSVLSSSSSSSSGRSSGSGSAPPPSAVSGSPPASSSSSAAPPS
jgi:hypothetical protein